MIENIVKKCDFFGALSLLRVKGNDKIRNVQGSMLSFLLGVVFISLCYIALINVLTHQRIDFTINNSQVIRDENSQLEMPIFAFGILQFNLAENIDFFTIIAQNVIIDEGLQGREIQMVPCTLDMWQDTKDAENNFVAYNLKSMLCPNKMDGIKLSGNLLSIKQKTFQLTLFPCLLDERCKNSLVQDLFFEKQMQLHPFLTGIMYTMDTQLNPKDPDMSIKIISPSKIWFNFNNFMAQEIFIEISSYQITTDVSFWPWQRIEYEYGEAGIIKKGKYNSERSPTDAFGTILFFPSNNHKIVFRKYGKIDETISYIGGLFSFILPFFGIFMLSFNMYRYELSIAESGFITMVEGGNKINEDYLTFFKYIKYSLFNWLITFCCCDLQWKDCLTIDKARKEASAMIDIKYLLKRISHLEHCNSVIFSHDQLAILGLAEVYDMSQIANKRAIIEYTSKIMGLKEGLTIENLSIFSNIEEPKTLCKINRSQNKSPRRIKVQSRVQTEEQKKVLTLLFRPVIISEEVEISSEQFELESYRVVEGYLFQHKDYIERFFKNIPELTQEQIITEDRIRTSFKNLKQNIRIKIIEKIPLPILYRLVNQDVEQLRLGNKSKDIICMERSKEKMMQINNGD